MSTIFVFGDSIAYGDWDQEGGWVNRLHKEINQKVLNSNFETYGAIYNLGIPGDTSQEICERFEQEIKVRIDTTEDTLIYLAVGVNDSQVELATGSNLVSPHIFKTNIQLLAYKAKKLSIPLTLIGITPVDESKVFPMPWKLTHGYKNAEIIKYNQILKEVAQSEHLSFVDVFSEFIKTEYTDLLLTDGVHPNTQGHQLLFEVIKFI
ncbi:hypothetical protein HGA88_00095 [Candidatus Roizmanbacteria bacterium]|nr:hypothetical protein [Candidatus Roizmanbacteria bacterium]